MHRKPKGPFVSHSCNTSWNIEELVGQKCCGEVGLIAGGDGDEKIGIVGRCFSQKRRAQRIAYDASQVKASLKQRDAFGIFINDRNVIVFGDEAFGDGCANSSRSDDQYLHELEVCLFDWRP